MSFTRGVRVALILCCTAAGFARESAARQPATAPTTSSTRPAQADVDVHEWVILVADPFQSQAGALKLIETTTLPLAVDSRRQRAPTTQQSSPCPVGVIRVFRRGDQTGEAKVDVKVEVKGGRVIANWPKGQARSASVLWQDMRVAPEPARLERLPDENWVAGLRKGTSSYLTSTEENRSERFLLYDVEVNYALPLKLGGGRAPDDAVQLANAGTVALHDVTLYRRDGAGWRTVTLAQLPPGASPKPDATTRPTTAAADDVFEPTTTATAPATQHAAATEPSTAPATQPLGVDPAFVSDVRLAPAPTSTTAPSDVLGDWKQRLARLGLVNDDFDVIVKIFELHALDSRRLTAVYRLDDAELDRLLPLEVTPQPRRTVRVGLVIAKNIDPAVPAEIDDLIARLGHRDWRAREQASESLAALGQAARAQLQAAAKHQDPEIATRAERLLARIEK